MLQDAQDALNRRDSVAALAAARAVLDAEPERADAQHMFGLALQLEGEWAAAASAFDRAAELAPDQALYQLSRASLAMSRRQLDLAEQAVKHALRLDPASLLGYAISTHLALGRGQIELADEHVKLAQQVSANDPLTLCMIGNLALAKGHHGAAQRTLQRAAEGAPREPIILSSLALALVAVGNHAAAEQALRNVLELEPNALQLRRMLIHTLHQQQRFEQLPEQLDILLGLAPDDAASLALLGDCLLQQGQRDAALAAYKRLLALPEVPAAALDGVLQALGRAGDLAAACLLLDERLATHPGEDALWQRRLSISENQPAIQSALIERWSRALPGSALALQARAGLQEQQGNLAAAEADADAAIARDPDLMPATLIKLRAEVRQAPEQALQRLDQLLPKVEMVEIVAVLRRLRAFALDRLQRPQEAIAETRAAAQLLSPQIRLPRPLAAGGQEAAKLDPSVQPRLLWGPPGSRIGLLAALLRSVPGPVVLEDRFGSNPRPDGLGPARADGAIATSMGWASLLSRAGLSPNQVIDWLPFWDDRIAASLAGSRVLLALDDPRDLLLNWLVFGSRQGPAPEPSIAAAWLNATLLVVAERVENDDRSLCIIDGAARGVDVAERVQRFFNLRDQPNEAVLEARRDGLGGLPLAFEPGHWRVYAKALGPAFALLRPVAQRLGYPAD